MGRIDLVTVLIGVGILLVLGLGILTGMAVRRRPTLHAIPLASSVWVAMYEHKHGTDIEVFTSEAEAEAFRQELANDWWDEVMEETKPTDPKEAADAYFAAGAKHGEFFEVRQQHVR